MSVAYMSRETCRDIWTEKGLPPPDMTGDVYLGRMEILFDDRMPYGAIIVRPWPYEEEVAE